MYNPKSVGAFKKMLIINVNVFQMSAIINRSVIKEISYRKGVTLYSPSAGFMGSLARQIPQFLDAR